MEAADDDSQRLACAQAMQKSGAGDGLISLIIRLGSDSFSCASLPQRDTLCCLQTYPYLNSVVDRNDHDKSNAQPDSVAAHVNVRLLIATLRG